MFSIFVLLCALEMLYFLNFIQHVYGKKLYCFNIINIGNLKQGSS